jgi:glycosyltransferase involved in cell wall biosynthesis
MKKLCIVSMFHSSARWYDEFMTKILNIDYPKEDLVYLFSESGSEDDTVLRLVKTKIENPDKNIVIHRFSNEGKTFASYYEKLCYCHDETQKALLEIKNIDLVLWIDSDVLIFPPDFVRKLVLHFDDPHFVNIGGCATMCCQENNGEAQDVYYDWGGFMIGNQNFSSSYPYFEGFALNKIFQVSSMGMCFIVKRDCFPMTFFHADVGIIKPGGAPIIHWNIAFEQLKRYNFYLDTSMRVYHMSHVKRGIGMIKKWR